MGSDIKTAQAFATSWNNLPEGSVYTRGQFEDWMMPLTPEEIRGKRVLELGCGNGSLMVHMKNWNPGKLDGVDLGDSVTTAQKNLTDTPNVSILKEDLVSFVGSEPYDVVYCIGVLHHLQNPVEGFKSVIRNTIPGGKFHCWVYAKEGNAFVRYVVDPLRRVASRLPWWFTKYAIATPLSALFYPYAKVLRAFPRHTLLAWLPLYDYARWIAQREYSFFRHVAFDQLVTPKTTYLTRSVIETWLKNTPGIDTNSTYIIMRNGNSWKFGGTRSYS